MSTPATTKVLMLRNCREISELKAAIETLELEPPIEVLVDGGRTIDDGNEWMRTHAAAGPRVVLMCLDDKPNTGASLKQFGIHDEATGEWFLKRWEEALDAFPEVKSIPRVVLHWTNKPTPVDPNRFFRVLTFDTHNRDVVRTLREALLATSRPMPASLSHTAAKTGDLSIG